MQVSDQKNSEWLEKPVSARINKETIFIFVIIVLAIISRFYALDARVMSHDETIHVYHNSWSLFRGTGYQHDPLSHGPLQTHLVAISYFLFGDSDFSARIPAVIFSIASIIMLWNYRRYLGKTGAIIAMIMMLISPYLLYYGRYVRNDIFSAFLGVVMLWSILRYLETGLDRYTYYLIAVYALHFTAKETSFIYAAQALIFLALYFVYRVVKNQWSKPEQKNKFLIFLIAGLLLLAVAGGYMIINKQGSSLSPTETAAPAVPGEEGLQEPRNAPSEITLILLILTVLAFIISAYYLISGYSWNNTRKERSFGLLILLGTFVLPQLSAFPVNFMGWQIPTNATSVKAMTMNHIIRIGVFFVPMLLISVVIGMLWNRKLWLKNAAIFYGIYTILFTTVFTNGAGFFTGMVGSLGYWIEQQGVERGSQPWYYYIFVQIPVYEYLPAIASFLAIILAALGVRPITDDRDGDPVESNQIETDQDTEKQEIKTTAVTLLGYWAITSVIVYTIAGEKMPWLTVHITWSLILCGSWAVGYLIDISDWSILHERRGWLLIIMLLIFLLSGTVVLGSLLGTNPPFNGKELENLQATSTFLVSLIATILSGVGLFYLLVKESSVKSILKVLAFMIFAGMALITGRTAYQAAYINYDYANELLVYAHSASGVKTVMDQVEEISERTTDGLALSVAFDGEYPFWWYLRNFTTTTYFGQNPTRSLRENPVIIVGEGNFGKIEPVVGQGYNQYDYIRLWWPNQDYYNLTFKKVFDAILNPEMREALFQIWLNRDYTKYGEVTGKDMSLPNWSPSSKMRLYVRKDIVSQLWNYGVLPAAEEIEFDPYEGKQIDLSADFMIGSQGVEPGQFQRPRGIAVAKDGTLYIADTENNRIQHLASDGTVLNVWGNYGDAATGQALGGAFNQPWGVAVGPDGSIYVADTWNHRIQKFSGDGEFIMMWGNFGQAEDAYALWGPRDIAVDEAGRVYITDTGNKRVVVYDENGVFISEFGGVGFSPGEFDEPVGIDIGPNGNVHVADTWNQRVQLLDEFGDDEYQVIRYWDVVGWFGQSLENKPFLAVGPDLHIFATDPEGYRVLEFLVNGELVRYWGDFGTGPNNFGLAGAVAVDGEGGVWVTDTGNSRVMHFTLPQGD